MMKLVVISALLMVLPAAGFCQVNDTVQRPNHTNVIKFNPTPMLIWGNLKNITFSYERTFTNNHSMAFQAGFLEFLPIFGDTVLGLLTCESKSSYGINLAFDYRFYPLKLNKFAAPRGLYFGPYISYYGFKMIDHFTVLDSDPIRQSDVTLSFNYVNLGFEIGYQFIFWNHMSVDLLVFGPSFTCSYNRRAFDGNLTQAERTELVDQIKEKIKEKYPTFAPASNISNDNASLSFRAFFRYCVSVGYRF